METGIYIPTTDEELINAYLYLPNMDRCAAIIKKLIFMHSSREPRHKAKRQYLLHNGLAYFNIYPINTMPMSNYVASSAIEIPEEDDGKGLSINPPMPIFQRIELPQLLSELEDPEEFMRLLETLEFIFTSIRKHEPKFLALFRFLRDFKREVHPLATKTIRELITIPPEVLGHITRTTIFMDVCLNKEFIPLFAKLQQDFRIAHEELVSDLSTVNILGYYVND